MEVKKAQTETFDEQSILDKDKEGEIELGSVTGGSLLTRGIKFSSISDFLSFMNGDETPEVNKVEVSEKEGGAGGVTQFPVVRLKRLFVDKKDSAFEKVLN